MENTHLSTKESNIKIFTYNLLWGPSTFRKKYFIIDLIFVRLHMDIAIKLNFRNILFVIIFRFPT